MRKIVGDLAESGRVSFVAYGDQHIRQKIGNRRLPTCLEVAVVILSLPQALILKFDISIERRSDGDIIRVQAKDGDLLLTMGFEVVHLER